jgi:hypothetical protein
MIRNSTWWTVFILVLMASAGVTFFSSRQPFQVSDQGRASIVLVKQLGLTDPALFTEASYIRHLSQADRHTAFQDHPVALEHFPTGSLVQVPAHLTP